MGAVTQERPEERTAPEGVNPGARPRTSILVLYPHEASNLFADTLARRAPRERMYGLAELAEDGCRVEVSDHRHLGRFGRLARALSPLVRLVDLSTVRKISQHDVVLVKDEFSLLLTLAARLLGKRIVYLDAMLHFPRRFWRRWGTRLTIRWSSGVITFTDFQARAWASLLGVPVSMFTVLPHPMDGEFYTCPSGAASERPYVLSVGRDPGRDFPTLIAAMEGSGLDLKLVTLPYLIPEAARERPWVQILQRVEYEELFRLYAGAEAVVVPIRAGMEHGSGTRAALEALALGRPTIASRTHVLQEVFADGEEILLVPPEDPVALRAAVDRLRTDAVLRSRLELRGSEAVRQRYSLASFAADLRAILLPGSRGSR